MTFSDWLYENTMTLEQEIVDAWNEYCESIVRHGDVINPMSELDETLGGLTPTEIINSLTEYCNLNDDWFVFNDRQEVVTLNDISDSPTPIDFVELAAYLTRQNHKLFVEYCEDEESSDE